MPRRRRAGLGALAEPGATFSVLEPETPRLRKRLLRLRLSGSGCAAHNGRRGATPASIDRLTYVISDKI